jgi:signal transduction histidine kinase
LHKGKITFTSELDKGTTFVVELGGIIKWQKY